MLKKIIPILFLVSCSQETVSPSVQGGFGFEIQLTTKDKKIAPTLKSLTAKSKLI